MRHFCAAALVRTPFAFREGQDTERVDGVKEPLPAGVASWGRQLPAVVFGVQDVRGVARAKDPLLRGERRLARGGAISRLGWALAGHRATVRR